jgi:hypothetical protein
LSDVHKDNITLIAERNGKHRICATHFISGWEVKLTGNLPKLTVRFANFTGVTHSRSDKLTASVKRGRTTHRTVSFLILLESRNISRHLRKIANPKLEICGVRAGAV